MPRIRTIKPEFWDSPSTAKAGPWARLAFIAMWNWADDFGRGTANLKELEGFIFPNDSAFTDRSGNTVHFSDIVAEVSECFGVVFYEVDGRHFYAIPSWDRHQRNERRAKVSRFPAPPTNRDVATPNAPVAEIPCISATQERKHRDVPALEQGNRGTGEQPSLGPLVAQAPSTPDPMDSADGTPSSPKRASRLPDGWQPSRTPGNEKAESGHSPEWLRRELARFRDYWAGVSGQRGRKLDWDATWRNWLRNAEDRQAAPQQATSRRAGDLTGADWDRMMAEATARDIADGRLIA